MRLCGLLLLLPLLWQTPGAQARAVSARMAKVEIAGVTLHEVEVRLDWPEDSPEGALSIRIERAQMEMLAEPFLQLHWQCPLKRGLGWRCNGPLRSSSQPPLNLAVDLSAAMTEVQLSDGPTHLHLHHNATTPDLTRINLTRVPLAWLQDWLSTVWSSAKLGEGQLDGEILVTVPSAAPLQIETTFTLANGALETNDGEIAAVGVGLQAELTMTTDDDGRRIEARGSLHGGEALIGNTYLELPPTPITLELDARHTDNQGWKLPTLIWRDGRALDAHAALGFTADAALDHLTLHIHSDDLSPWPARYLSGWLGPAGLSGLQLSGALNVETTLSADGLDRLDAHLDAINLHDEQGRLTLTGLNGHLTHAATGEHGGNIAWQSGMIGEVAFGPAHWPLQTSDGLLQLIAPAEIETLNGHVLLHPLRLHLPHAGQGLQLDFGLHLQQLDLAPLSTALGWPAFRGQLTGSIPAARYIDGWLELDGGLSMAIFDGRIDVTALVMERPFGVSPTLTVDLSLMNLDLMSITEVFDFGSISGRLDGKIDGLRLVDWSPTAFDAELYTVPRHSVRQRISQRAVQDISSIGGGGIMHSLQGRLITLFDDFGYRRFGIGCRLLNAVCTMSGLHSAGSGFTIVEGTGIPRLNVVGFNREVDWPTLIERLTQIADGAAPVVQ